MLTLRSSLIFPKLVYLNRTEFKSWQETGSTEVFKLDWSAKSKHDLDSFITWRKSHGHSFEGPIQYLPEPYESWANNLQFSIPRQYLDEIRRMSHSAVREWSQPRSFDTAIREMCLGPAIAYVMSAFKLISDCVFDPDTSYFYRGEDKILVAHCLLYRFWSYQTGRGLIQDHSDFDRLRDLLNVKWDLFVPSTTSLVKTFIDAIDKYEKEMEINYTIAPHGLRVEEVK